MSKQTSKQTALSVQRDILKEERAIHSIEESNRLDTESRRIYTRLYIVGALVWAISNVLDVFFTYKHLFMWFWSDEFATSVGVGGSCDADPWRIALSLHYPLLSNVFFANPATPTIVNELILRTSSLNFPPGTDRSKIMSPAMFCGGAMPKGWKPTKAENWKDDRNPYRFLVSEKTEFVTDVEWHSSWDILFTHGFFGIANLSQTQFNKLGAGWPAYYTLMFGEQPDKNKKECDSDPVGWVVGSLGSSVGMAMGGGMTGAGPIGAIVGGIVGLASEMFLTKDKVCL